MIVAGKRDVEARSHKMKAKEDVASPGRYVWSYAVPTLVPIAAVDVPKYKRSVNEEDGLQKLSITLGQNVKLHVLV